ncbi:MAG: acyl-CoA dehydrogenase family protein [Deltaproteobacteria bacterium]|nr:acyl-CoA dehydrogenase family protein [Deltaproteobacteria bacterium]
MNEPFNQSPPELGNQYDDDVVLKEHLERTLPEDMRRAIEPELREMGEWAVEMQALSLAEREREPVLTHWSPWGERIDHIELTEVWKKAEPKAAEAGVIAAAYDDRFGHHARAHQFALVHLFSPSSDVYSCPLAMTDGAARTLLASGNQALIDRAVPHLTSRDPKEFWTSGQWMTESTGGSDVGLTETVAKEEDGQWRLYGRKWFTSAASSQMALTLGRPEGNPGGGHGLALFYVECRDDEGRLRDIRINRLKDKLGTRKLPTAELSLEGTPAELVTGTTAGIRNIVPMLSITRTWNATVAVSGMRRGLALAKDYAKRRHAFGATLDQKPLHVDTLAGLQSEYDAAFQLAHFVVDLLGREERNHDANSTLLRLLTPIAKLTTARQGVMVASECLEAFGGAGYVEDTGLPALLRDAQVLSIWEGTTNVLSLDVLRALGHEPEALQALGEEIARARAGLEDPGLIEAGEVAQKAFGRGVEWLKAAQSESPEELEAGARRFALTLGRSLSLARLAEHAQWSLGKGSKRARAAALRFAQRGVDQIAWMDREDSALLLA